MMKPSLPYLLSSVAALLPCLFSQAQPPCSPAVAPDGLTVHAQASATSKRLGTLPYGTCLHLNGHEAFPKMPGTLDGIKGNWVHVSDGGSLSGYAFDAYFGNCPVPATPKTPMTLLPSEGGVILPIPAAHTAHLHGLYFRDEGGFSLQPVKAVQHFDADRRLTYTDGIPDAKADFLLASDKPLPATAFDQFWGWYPSFSPEDPKTHNIIFGDMRLSIRFAKGNHRSFVTELVVMNGQGQRTLYRHMRPSKGSEEEEASWPGNIQVRGVGDLDSDKRSDLILSYNIDGASITQVWLSSLARSGETMALAAECTSPLLP